MSPKPLQTKIEKQYIENSYIKKKQLQGKCIQGPGEAPISLIPSVASPSQALIPMECDHHEVMSNPFGDGLHTSTATAEQPHLKVESENSCRNVWISVKAEIHSSAKTNPTILASNTASTTLAGNIA